MEAIGRLSGGIAHDFNNLLGVIIGYSQVVKRALGKQNPLTEHVIEIEKAGDRAAALTRQLLAFSRQQILSPTVLNLNDLVEDMQKMLPRLIGEDITVSIVMDPELSSVLADRNQIEQVIMNLAVNARCASRQKTSNWTRLILDCIPAPSPASTCVSRLAIRGWEWMPKRRLTFSNRLSQRKKWARERGWGWPRSTGS